VRGGDWKKSGRPVRLRSGFDKPTLPARLLEGWGTRGCGRSEGQKQIPFGNDKQKFPGMTPREQQMGYLLAVAKRLLISSQLTVFHQAAR
jgi:hypothetical protein